MKKKVLLAIPILGVLLYAGDFLILGSRQKQFGSVEVKVLYAVKMRNRQTEYLPEREVREPETVEPGIGAGGEWIWELRTERGRPPVGCAGRLRRYPE